MLDKFGLLPFTVLIQTGYQKGEGYAENIPALWQAQQIYKFNIFSDYWEQNRCFLFSTEYAQHITE